MSTEGAAEAYEMAHVLFLDIVGYSLHPIDVQRRLLRLLQELVRDSSEFRRARPGEELISLPTGDGMALVFLRDPLSPVRCALQLAEGIAKADDLSVRMGIHSGPVQIHADIREQVNVVGAGINLAQRVMDCGDAGHILVSRAVAEILMQLSQWQNVLKDLGEHPVKHGVTVRLYNLCKDGTGNADFPSRLTRSTVAAELRTGAGKVSRGWMLAGGAVAAALILVAGWAGWRFGATRTDRPLTRLSLDLGPEAVGGVDGDITLSPDGRRIVYTTRVGDGQAQLATRLLNESKPTVLGATANAHLPFFSPDAASIGYFTHGALCRISTQGGAPNILAQAGNLETGGTWDDQGNIIAALTHAAALSVIPTAGGSPRLLTHFAQGEQTHRWPQSLPGGDVLFTTSSIVMGMEGASIAVADAKTGAHQIVLRGGYYARFLPGGYLLYVHQGVLSAVRFDPATRKVQGSPVPLVEDLDADSLNGNGHYHFSTAPEGAGTLVYFAGKVMPQRWNVTLLDKTGKGQPLIPSGAYYNPAFSPDGRQLAVVTGGDGIDIFLHDLARGTATRLTTDGTADRPVWSPDASGIVYGSKKGSTGLWWARSDGGADPTLLYPSTQPVVPWSFSPDGKQLAFFQIDPQSGYDIWLLPIDWSDRAHPKAGRPEPWLRTQSHEAVPTFSPDGKWIAYMSSESGQNEVYVRHAASTQSGKWQVSSNGGSYPVWSPSGHEMFYESPDNRIQAVDYIVKGDVFEAGKPHQWSALPLQNVGKGNFAMMPDGKRFAIFEAVETAKAAPRVGVLLNFIDELKRRLP